MDIRKKIGNRIKKLRNKAGILRWNWLFLPSWTELITSVENGKRNISIVNIEKIATALNISLTDFFNDAEFN